MRNRTTRKHNKSEININCFHQIQNKIHISHTEIEETAEIIQ